MFNGCPARRSLCAARCAMHGRPTGRHRYSRVSGHTARERHLECAAPLKHVGDVNDRGHHYCSGQQFFINVSCLQAQSRPQALDPSEWRKCELLHKEKVNHDSVKLRLGFDDSTAVSGLTTASCLLLRAPIGSQKDDGAKANVMRPYTPITDSETRGHFDLVVKVYPEGKMSAHLGEMTVGENIEVKGPIKKLPYEANMKKRIGMIAGGSGITPMYQVIDDILKNEDDKTEVKLIYANKTPEDILLKDTLDGLAAKHSNFEVHYVVEKAGKVKGIFWKGSTGYVTEDIVKKNCPGPDDDNLILVCGPPPMMNAISGDKAPDKSQGELSGMLANMGYTSEQVYKF